MSKDTFVPIQMDEEVPSNVPDLWKGYDPTVEPLDVEVVTTFEEDGIICKYVIYTVATVKGVPSRIAAYYTYPKGGEKLPAFVWAHGGGQKADRSRGLYFAKMGYATIDINWNGRELEPGIEKNTDWGMVDPSQGKPFYAKAPREKRNHGMTPDDYNIDPMVSPRNKSWFLLAVAGRRAITFLEQQPEVDADKIGFTGFSMGGNITAFVAIDSRLKTVVPVVGGTGFHYEEIPGYPRKNRTRPNGVLEDATIVPQVYWPHVKIPVLFMSGTNDFHGRIDFMQKCVDLLPHDEWSLSQTMHNNHNPGNRSWLAVEYWFDQYLKGQTALVPKTPQSELTQNSETEWTFTVTPDAAEKVKSVTVFYSWDSAVSNRYHKPLIPTQEGETWSATIPARADLPLTVFANVHYQTRDGESEESFTGVADCFSVTSRFYRQIPENVLEEIYQEEASNRTFEPVFAEFPKDNAMWGISNRDLSLQTYKFNDFELKFPKERKLKFAVDPQGGKVELKVYFSSQKYRDGERNEGSRITIKKRLTEPGDLVIALEDLVSAEGDRITSWHNVATMKVVLSDFGGGGPIDLLDSKAEHLKRIEWVDE
ncbi:MAG: alpha/beta hydrolase family protein [Roseibacillus sp.]